RRGRRCGMRSLSFSTSMRTDDNGTTLTVKAGEEYFSQDSDGQLPLIRRGVVAGRHGKNEFQVRKNKQTLSSQTKRANPFRTISAGSSRHGEFAEIPVIAKMSCIVGNGCGTKARLEPICGYDRASRPLTVVDDQLTDA